MFLHLILFMHLIVFDLHSIIFLFTMSNQQEAKFIFKNLEPIHYLKTFNRMIEHQTRSQNNEPSKRVLKIVSLTKFPLPKDYEHMEGIFQNANKKKIIDNLGKINKQQEQEQTFMKKHNDFMRKVLDKFIKHNESRQKTYEKQKEHYRIDFKSHFRSRSEPKIDFIRKENKQNQKHLDVQLSQPFATLGSEIQNPNTTQKEEKVNPLPKLLPRKTQDKIFIRKENNIQQYVINRKLNVVNPQSPSTGKRQVSTASKNQEYFDLKKSIVNLQMKQANKQTSFTKKIQHQIDEIERKMNNQIHAINYFSIGRDPQSKEISKDHNEDRKYQSVNIDNSRIDYTIKLKTKKT